MARTLPEVSFDLILSQTMGDLSTFIEAMRLTIDDRGTDDDERELARIAHAKAADLQVSLYPEINRLAQLRAAAELVEEYSERLEHDAYEQRFAGCSNVTTLTPKDHVRHALKRSAASVGVGSEPEPPRVA